MAWSRRRTRFQRQRPRRLRRARRLTRTRFRRRFRSRGAGTRSATVKLTLETSYPPYSTSPLVGWKAFFFSPASLNGFADYRTCYSKVRIKKCVLRLSHAADTNLAYLVTPSRNYAELAKPIVAGSSNSSYLSMVPPQPETALRQNRWQKVIMPNITRGNIRVGFHPYTLVGGTGPTTTSSNLQFMRVWNLNRWTPLSWFDPNGTPVYVYGPYIALSDPKTNADPSPIPGLVGVLEVWCQFSGQV